MGNDTVMEHICESPCFLSFLVLPRSEARVSHLLMFGSLNASTQSLAGSEVSLPTSSEPQIMGTYSVPCALDC